MYFPKELFDIVKQYLFGDGIWERKLPNIINILGEYDAANYLARENAIFIKPKPVLSWAVEYNLFEIFKLVFEQNHDKLSYPDESCSLYIDKVFSRVQKHRLEHKQSKHKQKGKKINFGVCTCEDNIKNYHIIEWIYYRMRSNSYICHVIKLMMIDAAKAQDKNALKTIADFVDKKLLIDTVNIAATEKNTLGECMFLLRWSNLNGYIEDNSFYAARDTFKKRKLTNNLGPILEYIF